MTVVGQGDIRTERLRHGLAIMLCIVVAASAIRPAWHEATFGVRGAGQPDDVGLEMRDFPAHCRFVRAVWTRRAIAGDDADRPSVYSPASHHAVVREWTGYESARHALPFGYSPTMMWLLGPFALLPDFGGYLAWTAVSLAACAWMMRDLDVIPMLLVAGVFVSPLALWSFDLGQTAILSTAGLLFLTRVPSERGAVVVLWALTAKPPLALTAGVALLVCGRLRIVIGAVLLTVVSTVILWPWLGPGWVRDYVEMLTRYTGDTADPTFAWSLVPGYMSNLRAVLVEYLGVPDGVASRVSSVAWLIALALVMVGGKVWSWSASTTWSAAILALLLLSPHVNSTEDLALVVPFTLWAGASSSAKGRSWWPYLFLLPIALTPGKSPPPGLLWPLPAFAAKVLLVGVTWCPGRRVRAERK